MMGSHGLWSSIPWQHPVDHATYLTGWSSRYRSWGETANHEHEKSRVVAVEWTLPMFTMFTYSSPMTFSGTQNGRAKGGSPRFSQTKQWEKGHLCSSYRWWFHRNPHMIWSIFHLTMVIYIYTHIHIRVYIYMFIPNNMFIQNSHG